MPMKPLKLKVEITLFWAPLLFGLLLNPGRNGSHIASFSHTKLWALLLCGLISVIFIFVQLLQPKSLINQNGSITTWDWLRYVIFATFMASSGLG